MFTGVSDSCSAVHLLDGHQGSALERGSAVVQDTEFAALVNGYSGRPSGLLTAVCAERVWELSSLSTVAVPSYRRYCRGTVLTVHCSRSFLSAVRNLTKRTTGLAEGGGTYQKTDTAPLFGLSLVFFPSVLYGAAAR